MYVNLGVMYDAEGLVGAVTAALSPDGSSGAFAKSLTDGLDGAWATFFNAPIPPGGTNWNAYTHEQLFQMLWEDADVGDVSAMSAEWGRHGNALTELADALRSQVSVLLSSWQGQASGVAADRLAELSDQARVVGTRANTVQKAAGDASDALALARNTMPPPPPDPLTLMTSAVGAGPMPPLQAVAVGGARIFTADAVAGVSKAEAVRVMQRYEASLRASSNQVVPGQPEDTRPRRYEATGETSPASAGGAGTSGGAPWSRLVGGAPPGPGGLVGAGPGPGGPGPGGPVAPGAPGAAALSAAGRARGAGGFFPPMGMAGWSGDSEHGRRHRSNLPNVDDNRLFALDERPSAPVIGDVTDKERNVEL
jgi:hypothetical protein